jgi:hypothetical protein
MSDAFNILGQEFDAPPEFGEAVRDAVAGFQAAAGRFQELCGKIGDDDLTEQEWAVVERTADSLAEAVERAEDGYVAVQFDGHAWYRIMDSLEQVRMRLDSASGIIENALAQRVRQGVDRQG